MASIEDGSKLAVLYLVDDDDGVRRLEQLHVVVVATWHHRWTAVEANQASFGQPAVFGTVGPGAGAAHAERWLDGEVLPEGTNLVQGLALGGQRRKSPVGRVDDQRRASIPDYVGAIVEPEVVLAADCEAPATCRERFRPHLAWLELSSTMCGDRLFKRGGLLFGQDGLVSEVGRSLERRLYPEVPDPLKIGATVGHPRYGLARDRPRHQRQAAECGKPPHEKSRHRLKPCYHQPSLVVSGHFRQVRRAQGCTQKRNSDYSFTRGCMRRRLRTSPERDLNLRSSTVRRFFVLWGAVSLVLASACSSSPTSPTGPSSIGDQASPVRSNSLRIVSQPQSRTVSSGSSATLNVVGDGSDQITYQWYVGSSGSMSNPISGATSESYATPALTATTSYWVRLSDPTGIVDSGTATITVEASPPSGLPTISCALGFSWTLDCERVLAGGVSR